MPYRGNRNLQFFTDPLQRFLGKEVIFLLDIQQDLDERTGGAMMLIDNPIDFFVIHSLFFLL